MFLLSTGVAVTVTRYEYKLLARPLPSISSNYQSPRHGAVNDDHVDLRSESTRSLEVLTVENTFEKQDQQDLQMLA
jgi:hypothetical protein